MSDQESDDQMDDQPSVPDQKVNHRKSAGCCQNYGNAITHGLFRKKRHERDIKQVLESRLEVQKCTTTVNDATVIDCDRLPKNLLESSTKSWQSVEDCQDEEKPSTEEAGISNSNNSSNNNIVDLVHQEITELEMRARAIRAMLKKKSVQLK
ncbi:unnamed protein product [Trichobilharzia szidati]|nr:unnamed protein product [Trichobilharzia szidati]CAH8837279.1 unnamed protein product [Trichobilharzia szidati]